MRRLGKALLALAIGIGVVAGGIVALAHVRGVYMRRLETEYALDIIARGAEIYISTYHDIPDDIQRLLSDEIIIESSGDDPWIDLASTRARGARKSRLASIRMQFPSELGDWRQSGSSIVNQQGRALTPVVAIDGSVSDEITVNLNRQLSLAWYQLAAQRAPVVPTSEPADARE